MFGSFYNVGVGHWEGGRMHLILYTVCFINIDKYSSKNSVEKLLKFNE